jgi:hypothetical protein
MWHFVYSHLQQNQPLTSPEKPQNHGFLSFSPVSPQTLILWAFQNLPIPDQGIILMTFPAAIVLCSSEAGNLCVIAFGIH